MRACVHVCRFADFLVHVYMCACVLCVYANACMYVCAWVRVCVCVCVCVHLHECVCGCVCVKDMTTCM